MGFPVSAICTAKTFSDFEESPQYPSEKSGVVTLVPQTGMEAQRDSKQRLSTNFGCLLWDVQGQAALPGS